MTCAQGGITLFSLIILVLTIWPNIFSAGTNFWVIIVSAIIILIVAWTGTECKYCRDMPKRSKR